MNREPLPQPKLNINPEIKTLQDLETWVTIDDLELLDYEHHPAVKYPFKV
jgi:thymidylate synthase